MDLNPHPRFLPGYPITSQSREPRGAWLSLLSFIALVTFGSWWP